MGIIYRVQLDGVDIFSPSKELGLLSTKLSLEINAAGTFTFTMPPCHTYYNAPKVMLSIVEILENDVSLFYGRVIEIKTNWNNEKEISCEGALAFFNDSIQRPRIWPPVGGTTTPASFLSDLIAVHNAQVSSDKAITIGSIDSSFTLTQIARSVDYCNTFNAIKEQCLDTNGGYMYIRRENNANVLYWVTENENASQPVQFGLNLLDLNTDISVEDLVTAVLPLGRDDNDNYVTISTSTVEVGDYPINGDYIYDQDLVEKYGTLLEVVNFDDVIVPQQLYNSACDYLKSKKLNFDGIVIDCSVAELRYLNSDYDAFNLGQLVHVSSIPHKTAVTDVEIDEDLMISRVEYNLNDASKSITIGNIPRQALSDKVSSSSGGSSSGSSSGGGGGGGGGGSTVTVTPAITTGDLIGTIGVNGVPYQLKYDVSSITAALSTKADASSVYTKTETDDLLLTKADTSATYTKTQTDNLLSAKADTSTTYTKTETDTLLSAKADTATTYSKSEVDSAIAAAAYTLPTASASTLGGVKVGDGLSIASGVLSTAKQAIDIYESDYNQLTTDEKEDPTKVYFVFDDPE